MKEFSDNQQWYFHSQIREFCSDGTDDITCPKPFVPLDRDLPDESEEEEENFK